MFTRRGILRASVAAGVAMTGRHALAKASQPSTPVNFDVPAHACDCHTHIHGDPEKFPFFSGRVYTPELASPEEMAALHKALHIERVVIVTPSVYGPDNSATLFGIKARGANARGVAVIDDKTPESDLDAMNEAGIRGIRLNLATGGVSDPNVGRQRIAAAIERVKSRSWHVQMFTSLAMISAIKDLVAASPVPVVFDHFGGAQAALGAGTAGLCRPARAGAIRQGLCQDLRRLSGLQACARLRRRDPAGAGADRGQCRPHRLGHRLAASEFGHAARKQVTDVTPLFQIDDGRLLNQLAGVGAGCRDPQEDPGRQSGAGFTDSEVRSPTPHALAAAGAGRVRSCAASSPALRRPPNGNR